MASAIVDTPLKGNGNGSGLCLCDAHKDRFAKAVKRTDILVFKSEHVHNICR